VCIGSGFLFLLPAFLFEFAECPDPLLSGTLSLFPIPGGIAAILRRFDFRSFQSPRPWSEKGFDCHNFPFGEIGSSGIAILSQCKEMLRLFPQKTDAVFLFQRFLWVHPKRKIRPFLCDKQEKSAAILLEQNGIILPLLRKKWLHFPNPKCFSTYSVAIRRVFRLMKKTSITVMKVATELHRTSP